MKNCVWVFPLILFFLFCYTGCGFLDDDYDGSPDEAYILSISENRPAEVKIGWRSYGSDGCYSARGETAERVGNHIYLTIKKRKSAGTGTVCPSEAVIIEGEFTLKNWNPVNIELWGRTTP